ncbi:MAG: sigma-54 dependent transcriptional regulator [Marinilabiliaceae bacterium]|jgi:DNA-binding NtrC family response regulator|nr:sigma-54 dependent transcriptional regulator [Marinilabiliaceae bacterium]
MKHKDVKILIADDNREILVALKILLSEHYSFIKTISNPNLIPSEIEEVTYDLILLDMNFSIGINSGNEGLFWLGKILEKDRDSVVVFLTAYGDINLAIRSLQEGAVDFIQKPWNDEKLLATVSSAIDLRRSRKELGLLKSKHKQIISGQNLIPEIIYSSALMEKVMKIAEKVAPTDAPVLILGESGTGKDLMARNIHSLSERSDEMFVAVDMGSIAGTLFESEMFGHIKGAFTDAREDKTGRFELAEGGTLFMDEVANIPSELQAKLLTVLQSGYFSKVGSNKLIHSDIRLISASNLNPEYLVHEGRFREDLLFRINTITITIPPLRERPDDVQILAAHFLDKFGRKYNKNDIRISRSAIRRLTEYKFPGNIRELEHIIERAVILNDSDYIESEDLFTDRRHSSPGNESKGLKLKEHELNIIRKALDATSYNYSEAAKALGISRKTLYNKIKKYGI